VGRDPEAAGRIQPFPPALDRRLGGGYGDQERTLGRLRPHRHRFNLRESERPGSRSANEP
jgi:hypothetical protein